MGQSSSTDRETFLQRLFFSFALPVTIPYAVYKLYQRFTWDVRKRRTLAGKVVLITGASSGLGEALAHAFYREGCRLILAARRKSELERVRNDLLKFKIPDPTCPPVVMTLDLEELSALPNVAEEARKIYGHVDILVNNGGISYRGEIVDTTLDVDLKVMVVNYFGQVALTKALLPHMISRNEGHIVAISSIQGQIAIPYRSAYAASKHALQAFYDVLRSELYAHDIQVTVVSPGYIKTNLSNNAVTANGEKYGVTDATTESGYPPSVVADAVVRAVVEKEKEVVVTPLGPRIALYLRVVLPTIYFWIMQSRAAKLKPKQ